jgi:hypothetical protein
VTAQEALRDINAAIEHSGGPDWWRRPHRGAQGLLRLPLRRASTELEVLAREFFISLAGDPELRERRKRLLERWGRELP